MLIYLFVYFVICIYGIKFFFKSDYDYLSRETTTSIKGIFILMVFFSHFNSYIEYTNYFDKLYLIPFNIVGQGMVSMFLFYSGFGIMEQIKNKNNYIKTFPVKRILNVLFQFMIAVLLYAILNIIIREPFSFVQLLKSLIGWESIGNSNWYIFVILYMYVITYFSFILSKRNYKIAVSLISISTIIYIIVMCYIAHKGIWWYDTALLYPLGILYSIYKKNIDKYIKKNYIFIITLLVMLIGFWKIDISIIKNIIFGLIILLLSVNIKLGNRFLSFCGKYLFEIYVLQRIPMIILDKVGFLDTYPYIAFSICFGITIILSYGFKKYINLIWNKFLKV